MTKILSSDFNLSKYGLECRLVNTDDSEFIVSLRTDPELSKYIHSTSSSVESQVQWIKQYKERESKGLDYYLIYSINGIRIGAERIYDIEGENFKIGSLIFSKDAPLGASILGDIITREIGFDILGFKTNNFEVMKENKGVNSYHLRYKPRLYKEDCEQYYYELSKENFDKYKQIYLKMFNKNN